MTETDVVEVGRISWHTRSAFADDGIIKALALDRIQTHRWKILTCSAMTGLNLQEGIHWVVQDAKDRLFLY